MYIIFIANIIILKDLMFSPNQGKNAHHLTFNIIRKTKSGSEEADRGLQSLGYWDNPRVRRQGPGLKLRQWGRRQRRKFIISVGDQIEDAGD